MKEEVCPDFERFTAKGLLQTPGENLIFAV